MSVFTEQPGKDFDANVRYGPLPGDHYAEPMQGYHEETILHQMEDDEPLDYKIADLRIGDIQDLLLHRVSHLTSEAFGMMFRDLAVLRARLSTERQKRFPKKEKA